MKISSATAQNGRQYQEDTFAVVQTPYGVVMGVFDGHGGDTTAKLCADHVEKWARKYPMSEGGMHSLFKDLASRTMDHTSGSTASIVFCPIRTDAAIVGTLGDSPVLIDSSLELWMPYDHNVRTSLLERDAAVARGGVYSDDGYIEDPARRFGLQMGRALGDSNMGEIISKRPDLSLVQVKEFICLATDGAFDPHHESDGVAIFQVSDMLYKGATAQDIVDRAVRLKTGDNVTVIVARP